ncbi:MAG: peptidoglycan DD-metalloendopeptidase family protein [Ignavibacteriae bacterium]|nr:peptidoglycan DD-metalloendopeptidase family protein [Ignavibacteriota bacterium]
MPIRLIIKTILYSIFMLTIVVGSAEARSRKKHSKGKKTTIKPTVAVQARQKELKKLQSAIAQTRQQVKQLSTKEVSTQKTLTLYQKQSSQISQHVTLLGEEIHELKDSIATMESKQARLERRLKELQDSYSKISREIQKRQAETENTGVPLAGNSPAPSEESKVYLKRLTADMANTANSIKKMQDSIIQQKNQTAQTSHVRENLLHLKENQQIELGATISARKKELQKIRADKTQLQKELAKKEQAAREVTQMISRLIDQAAQRARERQRSSIAKKEAELRAKKNQPKRALTPHEKSVAEEEAELPKSNFAGKFQWPLSNGRKILRAFGQYRNPLSNSIMDNPGIDIQAAEGSSANAAADGVVSLVHWLPGYSSLVIIDHGNNYRTVYANLSTTQVRQGQEVKQGASLGKTGESVDGEFLHFEVWRGRQRVNPVGMLGR